ncbi:MAG: hypothetical protein N6V49_03155 [Serratia symbiotica]|nr:hypothetical protein [Serratia symbiotica]
MLSPPRLQVACALAFLARQARIKKPYSLVAQLSGLIYGNQAREAINAAERVRSG